MKQIIITYLLLPFLIKKVKSQEKVFPGANETTLSLSQYFSWINNTNEGSTEEQTIVTLISIPNCGLVPILSPGRELNWSSSENKNI